MGEGGGESLRDCPLAVARYFSRTFCMTFPDEERKRKPSCAALRPAASTGTPDWRRMHEGREEMEAAAPAS